MDAMGSQEASSTRYSYKVFLNFRGKDTRKTFTDHLYNALLNAGIRTFRDDDELGRGEHIKSELMKAIKESRISVIVFSKDYASSTWCLDELLRMLECKESVGHMILPVFYDVNPSVVRRQTDSFAKSFAKHEEILKSEPDEIKKEEGINNIKRWKDALKEVADLSGLELKDEYETNFIKKIIEDIRKKLNPTALNVCQYPVGLDSRIKGINLWLQDGSSKVSIMAITGMGGIGKTTIAKSVYNINLKNFEGSSFLANIRETSKETNGLVRLQKQLLSNILKGRKVKISNVHEGIIMIKEALSSKRVLLVLDDVDQLDQLNAVLGMRDWIQQGSKIIITSRNEQLLKAHELYEIHKVGELLYYESLQLFSWHAFRQDHPIEAYKEHSKRVVEYCGGLPLALQVLGSSLCGRSVDVWDSALKKLEAIPDSEIIRKLRVSFDFLKDKHDKELFLDIACFFVGKDIDFVITVLDGPKCFTKVGIDNLIRRHLLTINGHNKLTMHQLLRDMGRDIIRQESETEPGERSRLWDHEDAFNVLREKTGTKNIEAIFLNLLMSKEDRSTERFFGLDNSKRHHFKDFLDESTSQQESNWWKQLGFSWLPATSILTKSSSTSNEVDLQIDAFSRMHNLRLLNLSNVRLTGNYKHFPRRLRWLSWRGFPLKFVPHDFPMESLVVLEMQYSSLEQVWKGDKLLKSLKILNLSHSHCLTNLTHFSKVPNLESLILKDCINLIEIHESIGELGRLVSLNLKDCKNLKKLPSKISQLKSLENLDLSGCSNLFHLPREPGKMESLKMLHVDRTVSQSLSMTTKVRSWLSDYWYWGLGPRKNPESISFSLTSLPHSLTSLSLEHSNLLDDVIPRDLGSLSLLQELNLIGNPISSLPESIKCLTMLQSLELKECTELQSLPELPMNLEYLDVRSCRSLEMLPNIPDNCLKLALYCEKLVEVQGLYKLKPIGEIDAEMISNLGLSNLEFLGNVKVDLYNVRTTSILKNVPLQVLYEKGMFSTFVPGSEVPGFYNLKSRDYSICFEVPPSLHNCKIQGFNVCVVYENTDSDVEDWWYEGFWIETWNRSKRLLWRCYRPTFIAFPNDENKDMIWLSYWKFRNQWGAGDEVNVSVNVPIGLKELGIHFVVDSVGSS